MGRIHVTFAVLLLAGVALAGCTDGNNGTTTTTTTPGTNTTTTTTTSTPPTVTVPTNPANNTTSNLTGSVTRVVVLSAPDRVAAAGEADVCIRVEGTGNVKHIAIHWDTTPHPNATAFAEYKGGAVYPGGALVLNPTGYDLPGVFCFEVPVAAQTVYFRGHALATGTGVLSGEHAIHAGPATGIRFTTEIPEVAPAKANVTVCWTSSVTGAFPHTAVHWDTASHPNSTAFADYKGGAVYPDNSTSVDAAGYTGPGPFCTNVVMPDSGAVYFRAHELNPGASVNAVSGEESIVVASPVTVLSAPKTASHGEMVLVCWRVEGAGSVGHTAVHWDTASHPSATAFGDYKGGAMYPGNASSAVGPYALPGPFCTTVDMPEDDLYFRAHVLVQGARNELSEEWRVTHED